MNKEELLKKIYQQKEFSEAEKAFLFSAISGTKKWGLVWEDKPDEAELAMVGQVPVLHEVESLAILNGNAPEVCPNHVLIEGDNLHALSALLATHAGKVDLIYIDPPYNTGNKEFSYKDHYADPDDAYRHSVWLSFMHKRLALARSLLKEDGAIFISIDDSELAPLKLLADELFGEQNFIDIFSWVRTETPARLSRKSLKVVEYVLAYQKSKKTPAFKGYQSKSPSSNGLLNQTNTLKTLVFPPQVVDTALPDGALPKGRYGTRHYSITLEEDAVVKQGFFVSPVKLTAKFKWNQEKLLSELAQGTKVSIRSKVLSPSYEKQEYDAGAPKNLIDRRVEVLTNEEAKAALADMGILGFSYPKPVSLIRYLLSFHPMKSGIVLDFMAGSGTTLHAVMELNAIDGGNRACMLVTNNENNIAEAVCYERNKRVIQGYTKPNGTKVAGLKHNNLRYYQCRLVAKEQPLVYAQETSSQPGERAM